MDESSARPLQYGHVGKALYHPDTQTWSFARSLAPPLGISYTGVTKVAIQSPYTSIRQSSTARPSTLCRGYPELIAGLRLAPTEALSHTITATDETCNPLASTLLDFGRAVDLDIDTSGRLAVPIVAFASGECGHTISFRTISVETVNLEQATIGPLRVPTIGDEDCVEWLTNGVPIRQICFSHAPDEKATFMAARSSTTTVFRPLYRRHPMSVLLHRDSDAIMSGHQASRIDPNFLVEISTSHTGGFAHADVKFSPWNQNQLALVDEDGKWGIWELRNQHKRNKDNWVAARVVSGSLPWVSIEESQGVNFQGRHDGWLAVEWAGNENHIIVCDRRCSMLYRVEGDRTCSYPIELSFKRKSEWILGIKRSVCNPSHVFILTSSRLLWFDVTPNSIPAQEDSRPSIHPRLSWRHFRDTDDTTLQLSSLAVNGDFYAVIFSRLNSLVQAFRCPNSLVPMTDSDSAPDPFILDMPQSSGYEEGSTNIHLVSLLFKEIVPTATDQEYREQRLSLLKAFAVDSRLCIRESLHSRPSIGVVDGEATRGRDLLRVRHLRLAGLRKQTVHPPSNFIIDDSDESALGPGTILYRGVDSIVPLADSQFTLDYTQIYAIATGSLHLLLNDAETAQRNFHASVEDIVNEVSKYGPSGRFTSQTALEILRRTPILDDIDQNAQDIAALLSKLTVNHHAPGNQHHLLVQPFSPPIPQPLRRENSVEPPNMDLVAVYDRLVNHWLVDLPANIPGRARIAKEKAIRHLLADLILAQIISARSITELESTAIGDGRQTGPSAGGLISSCRTVDERFLLETPVAQNSEPQASITTTRSASALRDYTYPDREAEESATLTTLSAYTTFDRGGPSSRDTERILSHWKPGSAPTTYTFVSEESQLAARVRASRRKSRKKISKVMNTLSLEPSIPLPVSSPVPAVRDWSSQADNSQPPIIRLQNSQTTDDLPMTQVERGAFGSREANRKIGMKAKRKKRAAGF
ncbi:RNA polymerase I-specific transcription initiation factor RRN6-like protein [Aspergillus egyptiacus]|nr:RNA polymerase I-specific transcription initiation factor RRN6-like protein [Aspergillus egyptiacus]